ncbi:hypothetical protein BFJ68_g15230 [Fusarium oxysporum]|uniref:AB hydrolase-1 domain-containing protein n=1 Tax=Fusarium oxysporum TaxID=5507 RepID=A0A420PNZ3_FUSOX|nr:hypothetical protein BFJ68_g15230 [Fusarium oxysporum]
MKSVLDIATHGIMTLAAAMPAMAQNLSFGADNFFRSEFVGIQPITFQTLYNTTIVGNLFTPNNISRSARSPAIIVGHPNGAVKEQGANLYAGKLAEQGFITLTLDLPFFGRSEGVHNLVSPDFFTEAYSAAVDHLGTYNFVDRERIGALGICGSGGYVISAAKIDSRIKAVATSSMYDMGTVTRQGLEQSINLQQRKELVAHASQQRWVRLAGGEVDIGAGTPTEVTEDSPEVVREFYDFYRTSRAEFTPEGWQRNMTTQRPITAEIKHINFYPFNDLNLISPRPLLLVSGTKAHSREFSVNAFRAASQPKELYWVPNAGHVDLYDRVDLIPFAKFIDFFRRNLVRSA